jgi:hypothetical protein
MLEIFPSNLFRAELLKAIKYPEISYRKYATMARCTLSSIGCPADQNGRYKEKEKENHIATIILV